jgi:ribosome-associated translation inhibitor RaiA
MQVLVNSNRSIDGTLDLSSWITSVVEDTLKRFGDRITRVEVHVNDVNSHKLGSDDKRCTMEARIGGIKPIAVSAQASTLQEAVNSAAGKLEQAIERRLGRLSETRGRTPDDGEVASIDQLQRLEQEQQRQSRE